MTDVLVGDGADESLGRYRFKLGSLDGECPLEWQTRRDAMVKQWAFLL